MFRKESLKLTIAVAMISGSAFAPADADQLLKAGNTYLRLGNYPLAIRYFQSELVTDPNSLEAHYGLGVAYQLSGRFADASNEFSAVISQDADNPLARRASLSLSAITARHGSFAARPRSASYPGSSSVPQSKPKLAAPLTSATTPEKARAALLGTEYESEKRDLVQQHDSLVAQLRQQMKQKMEETGSVTIDENEKAIHGSKASLDVMHDFEGRIAQLDSDLDHKLENLKTKFAAKRAALAQTHEMIETSLSKHAVDASVQLMPQSTNMYSRNYQTQKDPTGYRIPMMAVPKTIDSSNDPIKPPR